MDVLYIASSGADDPTRASIPWHLAVNGSVPNGHDVGIMLLGDAAGVLSAEVRAKVVGVAVPVLDELIEKARQHKVPVFV